MALEVAFTPLLNDAYNAHFLDIHMKGISRVPWVARIDKCECKCDNIVLETL